MSMLFLNLTRFGDLLQTQPAISACAAKGDKAGLLCLDNFAPAAQLLRDLDYIRPIKGGALLAALDTDWRKALDIGLAIGRDVARDFAPDTVANLTAMISAELMARQTVLACANVHKKTPDLVGFGLDTHGFGYCSGLWAAFLQAATGKRGCSPFNLVDIFCKAAGHDAGPWRNEPLPPDEGAFAAAKALLGEPPEDCSGFIALQLGASEERRRWPVERFVTLGALLRNELGLMPVLVGSKGEVHLAARYLEAGGPAVDCIGKTGLPELAAVLSLCKGLVSNDTGTMHLAAGLGRPVVAIFLATAQPWDTGPYQEGDVSLEPDLPCHPCEFGQPCPNSEACRQTIPPATVLALTRYRLGLTKAPSLQDMPGARVWQSLRETDGLGFMDLHCLSDHETTDRVQWVRLQRHIYRHFLEQQAVPAGDTPPSLSATPLAEAQRTLSACAQLLLLMRQQGVLLQQAPREALKHKFIATWQRLQAQLGQSPLFNVLSYLFAVESQEAGRDMQNVLRFIERYQSLIEQWQRLLNA